MHHKATEQHLPEGRAKMKLIFLYALQLLLIVGQTIYNVSAWWLTGNSKSPDPGRRWALHLQSQRSRCFKFRNQSYLYPALIHWNNHGSCHALFTSFKMVLTISNVCNTNMEIVVMETNPRGIFEIFNFPNAASFLIKKNIHHTWWCII